MVGHISAALFVQESDGWRRSLSGLHLDEAAVHGKQRETAKEEREDGRET